MMESSTEEPEELRGKKRVQTSDQVSGRAKTMRRNMSEDDPGPRPGPGPGPGSQSVSMKSDRSKIEPPMFRPGPKPGPDSQSVSMKSDRSKIEPPMFSPGPKPGPGSQSGLSSVSMKSDCSKIEPPMFSPGPGPDSKIPDLQELSGSSQVDQVFMSLEKELVAFVKQQLQKFKRLLSSEETCEELSCEGEDSSREAVLNLTLDFLRRMEQEDLAQRLSNVSVGVNLKGLKSQIKHRVCQVFEGVAKAGSSAPLQKIYTDLYIIEGGASEVNQEHEVRHIENMSRRTVERAIACENIFKQRPESDQPIRAVLTKGVAGVGKTVLTQKFSLDWAEGKANQEIHLLLPFTFRELNVLPQNMFSLVQLVHYFFPGTGLSSFKDLQVLFILDGLDECRLGLDFSQTRVLTDPTESVSLKELLVNLIRGDLLPFARIWITTRPAAASQIPAKSVSMVTEVRGFNNKQKEQYFTKRFQEEASDLITHIKSIRSLYIMSRIPIFSWMLATVLQKILEQPEKPELPKSLTQMYIHFLVVQAKVKNIKYHGGSGADLHWIPETKEMVWSLGKLAFEQLLKGNLIFYQADLRESGLDAAEVALYSGVFTEIFKEEQGLYQDKIYCFIHLTMQEFVAALHAHETFFSSGVNLLSPSLSDSPESFYRSAVDRALESPNGHLDLFVRFLLGLSLKSNQSLLHGLLTPTESDSTNQETVKYIKERLENKEESPERNLNLLHCLSELEDRTLVQEIQKVLRGGRLSTRIMSPAQWSAMSFVLLSSDSDLENFDLKEYCPSEEALQGLLPVLKASIKACLRGCFLTESICAPLASVLSSSSLILLDLSNNDLQDAGVELLCSGLKSAPCRLETLRLSGCLVSERGGASLATALSSSHSTLSELDLSYNDPGASAELLRALRIPQGPLEILRLAPAGQRFMVPGLRKYACEFLLDPNTAHPSLLLSEDLLSVRKVKEHQPYPDHPDRFTHRPQLLGSSGLRGRCYWEVDWSLGQRGGVYVGVTYQGLRRRGAGGECGFGYNDLSWNARVYDGAYYVRHNNISTRLKDTEGVSAGRFSVFLDSEAGALSFYDVSSEGRLSHLHTFTSSFSEPLFPGLGLSEPGDCVSVVTL